MALIKADKKTIERLADVIHQVEGAPVTSTDEKPRKGQNPYAVTRLCKITNADIAGRDDSGNAPVVKKGKAVFYYIDTDDGDKLKKMDNDNEVTVYNLSKTKVNRNAWAMAVYVGNVWAVNYEDCTS